MLWLFGDDWRLQMSILPFVSGLVLAGGPAAAVLGYYVNVGVVAFVLRF